MRTKRSCQPRGRPKEIGFIPPLITVYYNLLVATLINEKARVTSTEVVRTPEGIDQVQEPVHGTPGAG